MDRDEATTSDRPADVEESTDDTYYILTDQGALGGAHADMTGHST
jgi:glucose/arabinose dehydrogenase